MKKLFTSFLSVLLTFCAFAQSPEKMSYQAVIRNSRNALVTNTQVGMQISILQYSANGTTVYLETQTPTSNANGLVSVEIGAGTVVGGDFTTIDWANGPYFIKTETDPAGGTSYTITGTSQLLSVPYALHAKTAETVTGGISETDPVYSGSDAANIKATDITNLSNLSGTNSGDQDLIGLATTIALTTGLDLKVDKVLGKGLSNNNFSNAEKNKLAAISGTNTGDQDVSALATNAALGDSTAQVRSEIPDVSGFLTSETDPEFTNSQAANITITDITNLGNLSGTNTGDQDLSPLATKAALGDSTAQVRSEIPDVSGFLTIESDPTFTGSEAVNITATDITNLGNLSGTNTGDQDLSPLATKAALGDSTAQVRSEIPDVSGFLTIESDPTFTGSEAVNITATDIKNLGNLSGTNTGDQDLSGLATKTTLGDSTALVRSEIPDVSGFLITETDPEFTNSEAANITATDITNLSNLSGTNTGDQDISGIAENATAISDEVARATTAEGANATAILDEVARATAAEGVNASDIAALETEQTTQNAAIALNTAKTGITPAQATAITDNTIDIATNATAISDEVARATAAEGVNADDIAALEAGQTTQDAAIALNTAKTGITPAQATAITDNTTAISDEEARALAAEGANATAISDEVARATAAEGAIAGDIVTLESGQTTQDAAIALNTAKTGITPAQATAITDNTSDISTLQSGQTTQNAAIAANTAKVGVTSGTAAGQMQYWNGTAWVTVAATENEGATLQMIGGVPTWTGGTPPPPAVGDSYQGGVVFYILQSGDPGYVDGETHGLIAATSDQGWITWWNGSYVVTGATATALGTGSANTTLIISAQGNTGTYAAKACADYSVTVDGVAYDDWYLPSHNELYKFYVARSVVPGFSYSYYWSSTEADSNNAWWLNTYPTYMIAVDKKGSYAVRAIRSF